MPKSYADLLREARAQIREVSPQEVDALPAGAATIVDVREASEWEQGHLPGALHVSKCYIEQQIEGAAPDRDAPVILYCAGGVRSLFAAQTLAEMGYTNVASMSGGFQAWKGAGLDFETPGRADSRAEAALQPPPADPRGRRRPARPGSSARRRCSSAPAASVRRPRSISPPQASARSVSSTSTSSTSATSSARSSTPPIASASARSSRRASRSTRSTPTSTSSSTRRCWSRPTSSG